MAALLLALGGCDEQRPDAPDTVGQEAAPSVTPCESADSAQPAAVDSTGLVTRLTGDYDVTFVATHGWTSDSVVRGVLGLVPTQEDQRGKLDDPLFFPAIGSTTVDLSRLANLTLAKHAADSVHVLYERHTRHLRLRLGSPIGPHGATLHVGVLLTVHELGEHGLRGEWRDAGRNAGDPPLAGFFCAIRR